MLPQYNEEDRKLFSQTLSHYFSSPENLPIRYRIGEIDFKGMPSGSQVVQKKESKKTIYTYTATVCGLFLKADVTVYQNFASAEWKLTVTNRSEQDVRLSDFTAIDLVFPGNHGKILLCNGDYCSYDGYATNSFEVTETPIYSAPTGGRACDRAFPYQRLLFDGYGYNIAIGWPGQWYSRQTKVMNGVRFEAGQEVLDAVLHNGETVRTPLIAILAFSGDLTRGINVWRRWYLENVMPHPNGKIVKPFLHTTYSPPGSVEFTEATEENQISHIKEIKKYGFDLNLWWLDAGWYECRRPDGVKDWWSTVGDWECDRERFPNGLTPIGDTCKEENMDFLVWYESERVSSQAKINKEHPEWLIKNSDGGIILLNLGIPACREYLTKKIGDSIEESHATVYRQDYNLDPLPVWQNSDEENRKGITENLYLQGYLEFWDSLLKRFPNLIIDSCASGGRRNDLETMKRSVPMHESDTGYGHHPVLLSFFYTLYSWIPYFRAFNGNWEGEDGTYTKPFTPYKGTPIDDYQLYTNIAPMVSLGAVYYVMGRPEADVAKLKRFISTFYRVAPILETADFYPLTPYHKSRDQWTIFQFDKPEEKKGVLQVVRNNAASEEEKKVMPYLTTDGIYTFTNAETGESFSKTKAEIEKEGLCFRIPIRYAEIWEYTVR